MLKLLVITSYPEKGATHSARTVGVASYTKILLSELEKTNPDKQIRVLAEVLDKPQTYTEANIEVDRRWLRGQWLSLCQLAQTIITAPEQNILLSFEGYQFGSPIYSLPILLATWIAKLRGKKTHILTHQVVKDFAEVESSWIKAKILNIFKTGLYCLIAQASSQVIVFEQTFVQTIPSARVAVLPHLILPAKTTSKTVARQKLGWTKTGKYLLYFGYIAPYKGIDKLVTAWPSKASLQLMIAGGINPNHQNNPKISHFVNKVINQAQSKQIKVTGFVAEKDIPLYFSACDAVILPYTSFFSSSGPMSLAIAYKKPIMLSPQLKEYAQSRDFKQALQKSGLTIHNLSTKMEYKSIVSIFHKLINNKKVSIFNQEIIKLRDKKKIALQLAKILGN